MTIMKTKSWLILSILMIGFLINLPFVSSQEYNSLDLENIEALSSGETGDAHCYGLGSMECPTSYVKVQVVSYY
ncbi:hypothetical protein FACS189474_0990 [Bacteroidia bacterium]|nr:hypothetical protein FACS189474_0990 [Bacteroidia bacterium]